MTTFLGKKPRNVFAWDEACKRQFRDYNITLLGAGSVLDAKGFFPCAEGRFLLPAKQRLNDIVSVIFLTRSLSFWDI